MCYCELIKWLFYTLALFYRSGEIFCVGVLCDSFGLAVRLFLYLVRLIFTLGIYSNIRVLAIYWEFPSLLSACGELSVVSVLLSLLSVLSLSSACELSISELSSFG